jgi:hypothetical protein
MILCAFEKEDDDDIKALGFFCTPFFATVFTQEVSKWISASFRFFCASASDSSSSSSYYHNSISIAPIPLPRAPKVRRSVVNINTLINTMSNPRTPSCGKTTESTLTMTAIVIVYIHVHSEIAFLVFTFYTYYTPAFIYFNFKEVMRRMRDRSPSI